MPVSGWSSGSPHPQLAPNTSATGKPSTAMAIAGARTSARPRRPKRPCSATQPSTAPGTVTVWIPAAGIRVRPARVSRSMLAAAGAQPLAFRPCSLPVAPSCTMANRSPPIPHIIGATTPITALAAIAASAACPPRARIAAPAAAASGCSAATIPPRVITTERPWERSNDSRSPTTSPAGITGLSPAVMPVDLLLCGSDPPARAREPLDRLAAFTPGRHLGQARGLGARALGNLFLGVGDGRVVATHRAHVHAASTAGVDADPSQDRLPGHERLLRLEQPDLFLRRGADEPLHVRREVLEAVRRGERRATGLVERPVADGVGGTGE